MQPNRSRRCVASLSIRNHIATIIRLIHNRICYRFPEAPLDHSHPAQSDVYPNNGIFTLVRMR